MNYKILYAMALTIMCASPIIGFAQERADPIERLLFKPELIMQYSNQLGLDEQQQEMLRDELKSAQASIFDIKWQMRGEGEKLKAILKTKPIDEDQLLTQSDKVMELERQIKRVHLTLLARLKNMLSDKQIHKLMELRGKQQMKRER